ncbi:MAG: Ig-like domain-containing protein, partial [Bacteroidia bacterium]
MKNQFSLTKDHHPLRNYLRHPKILTLILSCAILLTSALGCKKDTFEGEVVGLCPIVVSTDPMDKAVDVALDKLISITFNTEMDATTINAQTLQIKQGTTIITGTYAATADPKVFTFKPSVALSPFLLYSGTVTTGAKDIFSTAMQKNYTWSFTTIPVVSVTANPVLGGTVSGAGAFAQGSSVTVVA